LGRRRRYGRLPCRYRFWYHTSHPGKGLNYLNSSRSWTVVQSCKEELQASRVPDIIAARAARNDVRNALNESFADVESWDGEFAFERSLLSMQYWKFWYWGEPHVLFS
jgi:hypothetical protein